MGDRKPMGKPIVDRFDAVATTWDQQARHQERAELLAGSLRDLGAVFHDARVLEYGCGTGLLSLSLAPHVKDIVAADRSSAMLDQLKNKLSTGGAAHNVRPVYLDLENDPPLPERFDLILTSMTLHHVRDIGSVLGKCFRMTADGGRFCIADLDEEDGSFHAQQEPVPHNGFNRKALSELLRKAGFRRTESRALMTIHKQVPSGTEQEFSVFLMTAFR